MYPHIIEALPECLDCEPALDRLAAWRKKLRSFRKTGGQCFCVTRIEEKEEMGLRFSDGFWQHPGWLILHKVLDPMLEGNRVIKAKPVHCSYQFQHGLRLIMS